MSERDPYLDGIREAMTDYINGHETGVFWTHELLEFLRIERTQGNTREEAAVTTFLTCLKQQGFIQGCGKNRTNNLQYITIKFIIVTEVKLKPVYQKPK